MTAPTLHALLVTETVPHPGVGAQEATRQSVQHLELVAELVSQHGGEVLLRVGQGCVARMPSPEEALDLARTLVRGQSQGAPKSRLRLAMHLGHISAASTAIAEPGIAEARQLLERAGPSETVMSSAFREGLASHTVQTAPLWVPLDQRTELAPAYRLLWGPLSAPHARARPNLSGTQLAVAVAVASAAVLGSLVAALLL